jgi:hypothetical protein
MLCQRCAGLLVREALTDCLSVATRCVNCGSVEDSVIQANRFCHPVARRLVPRRRVRNGSVVSRQRYSEEYASS